MIDKFNRFIERSIKKMQIIIPSFIDIVLMFLAQTQSHRIIEILVRVVKPFIVNIATHLGKSDWDSVTDSITLCFQATSSADLLESCKQVLADAEEH